MTAPSTKLTIGEQADFVDGIVAKCHPYSGGGAGPILLSLDDCVVDELRALAARLRRLAPHEAAIRKMVVGR